MSSVPWNRVCKPGGAAMLSTPVISPRIMIEQQNSYGMGRWT